MRHHETRYQRHTSKVFHEFEVEISTKEFRLRDQSGFHVLIHIHRRDAVERYIAAQYTFIAVLPEVGDTAIALPYALIMRKRDILFLILAGIAHPVIICAHI